MLYYHASPAAGLTVLTPRPSNHGIPLVYASQKRENVLVYLSNGVERHCRRVGFAHEGPWRKWASYGFREGLLQLDEYYPNATKDTYQGVGGYIYQIEGNFQPQADIPFAVTSAEPARVVGREYVPDAYQALLEARDAGLIYLTRYEDNSPKKLDWIARAVREDYEQAADAPDYRCFLEAKFGALLRGGNSEEF